MAVAIIELVSDGLLDDAFPFPLDTVVVVGARRGPRLGASRRSRSDGSTRCRPSSAPGTPTSSGARRPRERSIASASRSPRWPTSTRSSRAIVDQARELLDADVAVLLTVRPGRRGARRRGERARTTASTAPAGSPGADAARFVRPDLATARLEAPLQRAGETIGLLMVGSRLERGFEVDEVETLSSLANQAAIAIENARLQARLRELAVVAERERIAREMHDGLAQVLGYVNTKSQAVEELLVAGRTDEARGQLAELAAAARSIYVDVREAILGLRSPVVPGVGLVAAVEDYAARFAEASKIAVRVDASDAARRLDLAPEVEAQVFRIVQEALTNVRKHSGARRAEVVFAARRRPARGRHRRRRPRDRGRRPSPADRPRYGLRAMRERADSIGATVDWTPAGRRLPGPPRGRAPDAPVAGRAGSRLMRIVLADDHALFRDGVSSLLEAWGHEVVGRAADGARGGRPRRPPRARPRPDGRPDARACPASRRPGAIAAIRPEMPIVMLTVSEDEEDLFAAIQAGARGLPAQGPRGGPAAGDDRGGRPRRGGHHAGHGGPDHPPPVDAWARRRTSRRRTG